MVPVCIHAVSVNAEYFWPVRLSTLDWQTERKFNKLNDWSR
jgi:hypothetical protein